MIKNQEPCEIVYALLQIKLALSSLNIHDENTFDLGLMDVIKGRRNNRSLAETSELKAAETKNALKDEVHRFAQEKRLSTDLFDNLDSKIVASLARIALTTDNLSLELRNFMDDNPRRTGVNFTPVVIRQLMQSLLIKITEDKRQERLYDPIARTGDLLFSWPPLPFSKIALYSEAPFEREIATLFWNAAMLDQHDWQPEEQNIIQQTITTTLGNPTQASLFTRQEKYDAALSSVALSTGTVNPEMTNAKTLSTTWVNSIVESLNESGVAVLLLEDGFLHRTTFDYKFREQLVNQDLVEMVIALPANLYLKNAHFNASILVINKNKSVHAKNKVKLFHMHELKELKLNEIKELGVFACDLDTNIKTTLQPDLADNIGSTTVSTQQIRENSFSLRPLDYLKVSATIGQVDLDAELKKLDKIQLEWKSLEQGFRDSVGL